jgi:hypothetical protein
MENRKIIINPELFKLNTNGGTRKKKPNGGENSKIKFKKPVSMEPKNKKSIKNKILRYIREQQEKKYKSLFEENLSNHSKKKDIEPILNELDTISEIEDTIQHFDALDKQLKSKNEKPQHNHTVKNNIITDSQFYNNYMGNPQSSSVQQSPIPLPNIQNQFQYNSIEPFVPMKYIAPPHPGYGCLKRGKLETYKTLRNRMALNTNPSLPNHNGPIQSSIAIPIPVPAQTPVLTPTPTPITTTSTMDKLKEISRIKQMSNIIEKSNQKIPETLKYIKRKKTLKRTFFIGKSKVHPKIGVLIPNKTIRKNIMTKTHLLKQTPLTDMRKYLIKHGFIKVGSSAPRDVIAKMYESAILVGGEINNHNPENLLYNYFNAEKE